MIWTILALVLLCALYVFLILPQLPRRDISHLMGYDYAHRGLWDDALPENSLPAFAKAAEMGFGIELDVQLTADGQMVVFHDDDLSRMCGVQSDIHDCTLDELRRLRLNGTDCTLPTFAEVLAAVSGRVPLIVEIKTGPRVVELCEKVHAALGSYAGAYCIESFDPRATAWWRKNAPEIIRGTLAHSLGMVPRGERSFRIYALSTLMQNVIARPDFIAYGHEADRNLPMALMRRIRPTLVAWTIRSQADMDRLRGRYDLQIFERFVPRR